MKVLTFVCVLLSGTPAAVNQLVVTQLYNPEGSAHTLSRFLLIQCEQSQLTGGMSSTLMYRSAHARFVYCSCSSRAVCRYIIESGISSYLMQYDLQP